MLNKTIVNCMESVVSELQPGLLKEVLESTFERSQSHISTIEHCFQELVSGEHPPEKLRYFFNSWSMTNNSALSISGLSNRISMQLSSHDDIKDKLMLSQSIASLNRVTDEDLAVVGGMLHIDLFYQMATFCCGDDAWLSRRYTTQPAREFKQWKDKNTLKSRDLMSGFLTTLMNEIYTHGEVEYIYPLFYQWLVNTRQLTGKECEHVLNWILVHCGATEKEHFKHAIDAMFYYCQTHKLRLSDYALSSIFTKYLEMKGNVMESLIQILQQSTVSEMAN